MDSEIICTLNNLWIVRLSVYYILALQDNDTKVQDRVFYIWSRISYIKI